ncbi:MAG: sterol desaturase family protein [Cytophagaceae bacterium]
MPENLNEIHPAIVFFIMVMRYVVIAGPAYLILYILFKHRFSLQKIQTKFPEKWDYIREVTWSVFTLFIFTVIAYVMFHPYVLPHTLIYQDFNEYGFLYSIFSFVALVFFHDAYFYWTHRFMHHPKVFKILHLVHHKSTNPSPWAAFAFHPLEAIIEAGVLIIASFIIPLHYYTMVVFIMFMTIYNVYGHLGYELYPKWINKNFIGKWLNTSVNHNMHHKHFHGNYGLYFRFWDEWMGTTRKDYEKTFDDVTGKNVKESDLHQSDLSFPLIRK